MKFNRFAQGLKIIKTTILKMMK